MKKPKLSDTQRFLRWLLEPKLAGGSALKRKPSSGKPKLTVAQILLRKHLQELTHGHRSYALILTEYKFAPNRRFRFDLYIPMLRCGIEVDGGRWKRGHRSSRDTDMHNEKYNLAQLLGYKILTFTNEQVLTGKAKDLLREYLPKL